MDEVEEAVPEVLATVTASPGQLDAHDVVDTLRRERGVRERASRRAIWRLITSGQVILDDQRRLMVGH